MIQWIPQEHKHGCAIATLAMVSGKTYQEVYAWFVHHYKRQYSNAEPELFDIDKINGLGPHQRDMFLVENGFAHATKYNHLCNEKREVWPVEPWADVHICSVDNEVMSHSIVLLRGGSVLDPLTPYVKVLRDYLKVNSITAVYKVN